MIKKYFDISSDDRIHEEYRHVIRFSCRIDSPYSVSNTTRLIGHIPVILIIMLIMIKFLLTGVETKFLENFTKNKYFFYEFFIAKTSGQAKIYTYICIPFFRRKTGILRPIQPE
jgi:hypothetical protein